MSITPAIAVSLVVKLVVITPNVKHKIILPHTIAAVVIKLEMYKSMGRINVSIVHSK